MITQAQVDELLKRRFTRSIRSVTDITEREINDVLLEIVTISANDYATHLEAFKFPRNVIMDRLNTYIAELNTWRQQSLTNIMRKLSEPFAPSHALH